jgi:hypothetical protein
MTRIAFVVEGPTAESVFEGAISPRLRQKGIQVKLVKCPGRDKLIAEAEFHLENLRKRGYQHIFFILDQEKDECPPATAKRLEKIRQEPDVIVCVVSRMLEAWLLADKEAIQKATGQSSGHKFTDELPDPVDVLKTLFYRKDQQWRTEKEMARMVARHFCLERAAARNHSAHRFLTKLREHLGEPV